MKSTNSVVNFDAIGVALAGKIWKGEILLEVAKAQAFILANVLREKLGD